MTKLDGVAACVFDAYGTLFDVHAPVRRMAGEIGPEAEALSRTWREKQLQYTWLRSLMGVHADFGQITEEALDYALEAHGADRPGLAPRLLELYSRLDAYPDAAPMLEVLKRRGKKTAILSNGSPEMLDAAVGSAGLRELLDAVLSVEEVGIYKPDRRVYALACDYFEVRSDAICFVSNNAWDASGAAAFGFRVVRLDRFGTLPERLPGDIAATVPSLADLPGLLG